jgi:glycosyltransferase involved in cell wall biosynthesis
MPPLITVITPTFNRACFLQETIISILSQTYTNFEYFIIDDGSTDDTENVVKRFLNDKRVTYYKHENKGESKTTNRGYYLAKGELSIVVNSDDPLYRNDYFSMAVNEFNNNPDILAVCTDYVSIDEKSNILKEIRLPELDYTAMLCSSSLGLGPGMMIKTDVLRQIGFRNEAIQYTGDLTISLQLARMGKIKYLHLFGATHRDHAGNAAKDPSREKITLELLRLYLNVFNDERHLIPKSVYKNRYKITINALIVAKKTNNHIPLHSKYIPYNNKNIFKNKFEIVMFNIILQISYLKANIGFRIRGILKKLIKGVIKNVHK